MARVLLAWELGAGAGHLAPLAEAGRALAAAGHECAFALRDLGQAHTFHDVPATRLYQSPLFLPHWRAPTDIAFSFADILANIGYREPGPLTGLLSAWRSIYADFEPELIVFDHAPTAQAAARGLAIPSIILARTGFTLPPAVAPLPRFRQTDDPGAAVRREENVARVLNAALDALDIPRIRHVGELFEADARVLLSIPELDPYGPRDDVACWRPLAHDHGRQPNWPGADNSTGRKVFAYLHPFRTLDNLLESLAGSGCPALVHVAGMDATECERRSRGLLRFSPEHLDITRTLAECDLVITHASSLAAAVLLAGKPMLTLPLHIEQQLTAMKIEALGAGLNAPRLAPDGMHAKLERLLNEPEFASNARAFAARYQDRPAPFAERFNELAAELVAGAPA